MNSPWIKKKNNKFGKIPAGMLNAKNVRGWGRYSSKTDVISIAAILGTQMYRKPMKPEHIMQLLTLIRFKIILNIKL